MLHQPPTLAPSSQLLNPVLSSVENESEFHQEIRASVSGSKRLLGLREALVSAERLAIAIDSNPTLQELHKGFHQCLSDLASGGELSKTHREFERYLKTANSLSTHWKGLKFDSLTYQDQINFTSLYADISQLKNTVQDLCKSINPSSGSSADLLATLAERYGSSINQALVRSYCSEQTFVRNETEFILSTLRKVKT